MKHCVRFILAGCLGLCFFQHLQAAPSKAPDVSRPNIIFILADDLGYGDIGAYKKQPSKIPTPNVDRLAREGIRFTDAHSPASVCSPTRYALLTGRYAWRSSLQSGVVLPWGEPLLKPGQLTVAEMLKENGYTTGLIGKWHLGMSWPTKDGKPAAAGEDRLSNVDFTQPFKGGPLDHGFDHYFGVDVPNYPPYCFLKDDRTVGIPTLPDTGRVDGFNRPGPMIPGWKLVDILPELNRQAVSFVEQSAQSGKPFFLYYALTSPHYPVVPAKEFQGKTTVGDYGDFVFQTDWCVGQILEALERQGVAENTLVVFTSDNGPEITGEVKPGVYDRVLQYKHHSLDGLRGAKRDLWEAGHRVPFVARWPRKIEAGRVSEETICHVDFMSTVAAILGTEYASDTAVDSHNLLSILWNEPLGRPVREATVHHSGSGRFAIRKGEWVLIAHITGDDNRQRGEPEWLKKQRGYLPHNQPGELYHLKEDLIEKNNLYAEKPEIVAELRALLEKYVKEGRSTPGPAQTNDVPVIIDKPIQKPAAGKKQ
ncbi:Arylsulfatase A [Prosthecobacter debontii]|uniref:Arylsulfatase A n=1 Tax=Prosthecobacter debontii TaxID=48467 RepID=A0A1T4YXY7_9BACT|nr:arylsulfatase [Prosthecobacter debontii]SKB06652.1 Arylsulfatase A [Prosthecobacter debontii]